MIYLIEYTSYRLLINKLNELNKEEYEIFDLNKTTLKELLTDLSYEGLFKEKRNILIKNALIFTSKSKEDQIPLINFLENANTENLIVFITSESVDERKKVTKTLSSKHTLLKLNPPKYQELDKDLINYLRKYNYRIDNAALNYLKTTCNNNYDIMLNELDKLILLDLDNKNIDLKLVSNIVSHTLNDNNFKIIDAVIDRDLKTVMNLLNDYKLNKEEPLILITLLAREYRNLYLIKSMINNSKDSISRTLGLKDWQINKYINKSYDYSLKEIEDKIISLAELDYQIKTGIVDSFLGLELFVIKNI